MRNAIYVVKKGDEYVPMDVFQFFEREINITLKLDELIRKMRADRYAGKIRIVRDDGAKYVLDSVGMTHRSAYGNFLTRLDYNNVKVCLEPSGDVELYTIDKDKFLLNLGRFVKIDWLTGMEARRV